MESQKNPVSEFAIASLIMGLVSFVQIFNIEKPLVAITFGILALNKIKSNSQLEGKKFAIAGIALGIVCIILVTIMIIKFLPQLKQMHQQVIQEPVIK